MNTNSQFEQALHHAEQLARLLRDINYHAFGASNLFEGSGVADRWWNVRPSLEKKKGKKRKRKKNL